MSARRHILGWAEEGRIAAVDVRRALAVGGALPTGAEWRWFVDQFLLWLGAVLVATGVAFFVAHNWDALGRFAKLGLVEAALAVALGAVAWLGLDRPGGKAALLGAAVLTGALLAFVGQTYQTGADTFELFAAWGLAILPWALLGRLPALWLLWLVVANLAVTLYYTTFGGLLGMLFKPERLLWILFAFNTLALVVWEALGRLGVDWLAARWAPRLIAAGSGGLITTLALWGIVDPGETKGWGVPAWLLWLGAAYLVYRRTWRDVFVLAVGVSSVVVVVPTFLTVRVELHDSGGFLLISLVVIGLSAVGARWLRAVAAEGQV
ncbi:MAG: DUF2157 domain-containing protein [Gammaproteobacteria bacterium]|jgi:uncharacterized membrane protein|nr:DUF2157 domain-containing protein [Gammaproteobacteria bacterium]